MNILKKTAGCGMILAAALSLSSCVNEWPNPEYKDYTLYIHFTGLDWLPSYEMEYTRADNIDVSYIFRIYPHGNTTMPVKEMKLYRQDLERNDFSVPLQISPGTYDIYAWSDLADTKTGESLYYNTADFAKISYKMPYVGDTNDKDAFRGMTTFTVEDTMDLDADATVTINLTRPLARYIFEADDLLDFINNEITRGKMRSVTMRDGEDSAVTVYEGLEEALGDYTVKISYPLYMPAVFDNFQNNPIDSDTGVSFTCGIKQLTSDTAQLGLDYVMVNGEESSVQVMLEVFDEEGVLISSTNTLNVPTKRDRTTIIRGNFLTTLEKGGVTIDPDFSGQFNIQYK